MAKRGKKKSSGIKSSVPLKLATIVIVSVIILIVSLIILLPKEKTMEEPVTSPEQKAIAGQAISGFETTEEAPIVITTLGFADGTVRINPASASAIIDSVSGAEQFTVEIVASPKHPDPNVGVDFQKFNKMDVTINFDSNLLSFVRANLPATSSFAVAKFTQAPVINIGLGTVSYSQENLDPTPAITDKPTAILELTFKPIKSSVAATMIQVSNIYIKPPGNELRNAVNWPVTPYPASSITIKNKYYKDADGDKYGSSTAYTLSTSLTPPLGYIAQKTDCDDSNAGTNPGIPENTNSAYCNSVDNDCDGTINDEVMPACSELAVDCGIHRVCGNTKYRDCNIGATGSYLSGSEKCGAGFVCDNIGKCISDPQTFLVSCQNNLGVCNTNLGRANTRLNNFNYYTPSCGDGVCNIHENLLSCPNDCTSSIDCPTTVNDGCVGNLIADLDGDGLSNDYEIALNLKLQASFPGITHYDSSRSDTDGDGVADNFDFCPGTDSANGVRTLVNGFVAANGCPVGDLSSGIKDAAGQPTRPDGRFTFEDFNFMTPNYQKGINFK